MSSHIKEEIIPDIEEITEKQGDGVRKTVGVIHNPLELLKKHLTRFLERLDMMGEPLPGGNYKVLCKTGDDGSRHSWFKWAEGQYTYLVDNR
jgi:hypothetical protein